MGIADRGGGFSRSDARKRASRDTSLLEATERFRDSTAGWLYQLFRVELDAEWLVGDWLYPMPDGSTLLDVRLTIRTDDNELIFVEYGGVMAFPKEAPDRLAQGEVLTHEDGYFLTAPRFMTTSTKYAWLNHVQAVGKMVSVQRGHSVKYDIFAMEKRLFGHCVFRCNAGA